MLRGKLKVPYLGQLSVVFVIVIDEVMEIKLIFVNLQNSNL